jgi:hypothetical protein
MKVIKIDLRILRNEEHFQLMTDFKKLVEEAGAAVLNIEALFTAFIELYGREDIAIEAIRKSGLTDVISDADSARDSIYRGFVLQTESYLYHPDAAKVQAARNIQALIDHYGDFRKKTYNEETASITNFVQDITDRCAADLATLNADGWITDLAAANRSFDELMNRRFDESATQEHIRLRDTRREINTVYIRVIDFINAAIIVNGSTAYADFVNKLNERIQYFKNTLKRRRKKGITDSEQGIVNNE